MSDIMYDDIKVDWRIYSVHDDNNIKGFFGEYRWLSNFEKTPVMYQKVIYPTSENAYMASKIIVEDRSAFEYMTAYESKKSWRKFVALDKTADDWDARKYDVMYKILFDKFTRNVELRNKLISTREKYLEETNHWQDTYWGVDYKLGGENNLGKILMDIRKYL